MDDIAKGDELLLLLQRAGWSIGDTAFIGQEALTWLVYGTKAEHEVRTTGPVRIEAWKQACRPAEAFGLMGLS
jgi:hypothetical protein